MWKATTNIGRFGYGEWEESNMNQFMNTVSVFAFYVSDFFFFLGGEPMRHRFKLTI